MPKHDYMQIKKLSQKVTAFDHKGIIRQKLSAKNRNFLLDQF